VTAGLEFDESGLWTKAAVSITVCRQADDQC